MIIWTIDSIMLLLKVGYYTALEAFNVMHYILSSHPPSEREEIEYLKRHLRDIERQLHPINRYGFTVLDPDSDEDDRDVCDDWEPD